VLVQLFHFSDRYRSFGWLDKTLPTQPKNTALKYCSLRMSMERPEAYYANPSLIPAEAMQSFIKGFSITIVYEGIAHARAAR
jgi:hypothetical protein